MPADASGHALKLENLPPPLNDVIALSAAVESVQDEQSEVAESAPKPIPCRPLVIYTRPQILHLQGSPLVKPPPNMPELKQWFGDHEPNSNKKDSEPSTPNSARERRFRRDAEDGESSSRPSFRSALSQPSQMGSFKHQSLRDRDRDRDGEKDRERDKEGLRNLSEKYDRDRLAAPGLRNKERDIAPHLAMDSALRGSASLSATARRAETRDGAKKKVGEVSEDWRRGTRQDKYENSRPNREDRERPRSRGRDLSASRRDAEDKDTTGDQRKPPRDDRRTRDDHRRDREERRDRDQEEDEDPRRWRDDGKRDERMAARRAERLTADKSAPENGDSPGDRRWTVVEERDGRTKRNHRDRRAGGGGGGGEEGKEKEDRRDREKEPAWMDNYIPESPGPGILGGKGADGELDGIQAWKKGLKEQKEKNAAAPTPKNDATSQPVPEKPMDEIQLFRMMMKREEEKKQVEPPTDSGAASKGVVSPSPGTLRQDTAIVPPPPSAPPAETGPPTSSAPANNDTASLLSLLGKVEPTGRVPSIGSTPATDSGVDKMQAPVASRFFPNPLPHAEKPTVSDPPQSVPFNPPSGSRLLAFGARKPAGPPSIGGLTSSEPPPVHSPSDLPMNRVSPKTDSLRAGFSPFEEQSRMSFAFDEPRDQGAFSTGLADPSRRSDRSPYGLAPDSGSYNEASVFDPSAAYAAGKGSRLAKIFDSKGRDNQSNPGGFTSSSPNPSQRHDGGYNPMDGLLSKLNTSAQIQRPNIMSPNSALSPGGGSFSQQAQHNLQLLQQQQQQQQQQQSHHPHLHANSRLESLYESRLDDRNFVPDGMVPGLRSAPPPRSRDNAGLYSDSLEDSIHFSSQRLPPQHHRGLDPMYNPVPSVYSQQQGGRNAGIPMQPQFRGGPSPISNPQQRLPPGLANLGGRPPLEGSQFLGMPGLPSAGLHNGLHSNAPPQQQQQQFNSNFAVNGNLNYGNGLQPQMRVPSSSVHQLQGNLQQHHQLGLAHPNLDLRGSNQAQLLGLGSGGMRGMGGIGGFGQQQGPGGQLQPLHALRQQEQQQQRQQQLHQQLPPHMAQHHGGGHPHHGIGQQGNQPDLMALLMGGTTHRD
ncbi:hypothetical protein FB45DRAFT_1003672 [Roridomyces roridus]|uniref:Uncharacterized protein n=1 Tax=Roridomyces roridus TaxID=1738132 RepID=A0AAD7BTU8_9AGAR|nr:hypothetical protein FB45DRAFT_1003672 [Roridomyces roridus]